jgi:hypothetical protein
VFCGKWLADSRQVCRFVRCPALQPDSVSLLAYETPAFLVLLQTIGNNQVSEAVKIIKSAHTNIKELGKVPFTLKSDDISN